MVKTKIVQPYPYNLGAVFIEINAKLLSVFTTLLLGFIGILAFASCGESSPKNSVAEGHTTQIESTFIGSMSCKSCHESAFQKWEGSHHDLAMQTADSSSVLANFNQQTFTSHGVTSTFTSNGNTYYVNTQGPDGAYHDYKIEYTFGVTPLQQYIVKFPDGAYQCLQTAWDINKNVWFDLQPDLDIKHDEWIHWSHGGMRWNTMCADCHSTDVKKNFDIKTETYNTTFSEINAGCESCHGPSSSHVAFYQNENASGKPSKLYMDASLSSQELVEKCARCHSRRSQITNNFDYDEGFYDHYSPALLTAPNYETDGQIKGEDYVYGSFIQSKMYHNDVSCRDCHDVHSLELKAEGNLLCLSCHEPEYNNKSHHFHGENTVGAQCVSCHMTGETYMGNDFRRDHSFRIPRPDQSVAYGTPNACTECHTDRSDQWAMDVVIGNYGTERADHFSDYLLAGNAGDQEAYYALISNDKYPAIARATAVNQYGQRIVSAKELNGLLSYLNDPEALLRIETLKSLNGIAPDNFANQIKPLLMDSLRSVRIAAAEYFSKAGFDTVAANGYNSANEEYIASLNVNADFATGQMQIALYHIAQGNTKLAITAFEKSIELDNYFNPARMNLALVYYQNGNVADAENLYLKVIEQEPDFGESYYMLGLLYNEKQEAEKSKYFLAHACETSPVNVNAFYNLSLILLSERNYDDAISLLERGLKRAPNSERLLYAKLSCLVESNQLIEAKKVCLDLIKVAPQNPNYQEMLQRIQGALLD